MWLSSMRLEPLEVAGCSWWMDGRTVGRGCNLWGESRLGGTEREAWFQRLWGLRGGLRRPRNLEVGLGTRIPEWG